MAGGGPCWFAELLGVSVVCCGAGWVRLSCGESCMSCRFASGCLLGVSCCPGGGVSGVSGLRFSALVVVLACGGGVLLVVWVPIIGGVVGAVSGVDACCVVVVFVLVVWRWLFVCVGVGGVVVGVVVGSGRSVEPSGGRSCAEPVFVIFILTPPCSTR